MSQLIKLMCDTTPLLVSHLGCSYETLLLRYSTVSGSILPLSTMDRDKQHQNAEFGSLWRQSSAALTRLHMINVTFCFSFLLSGCDFISTTVDEVRGKHLHYCMFSSYFEH